MKHPGLYIGLCMGVLGASGVYAQSNTRGTTNDTVANRMMSAESYSPSAKHKILLIPFYPNMCMSEIGKDVNAATHLSYNQMVESFRRELDLAMYRMLSRNYTPVSILQGQYKSDSVLSYIYASTGYKYDIVPGAIPDAGGGTKNNKGLYIQKGALQVPVDYSNRFMNISISNPQLLQKLYKKYHTDTFVFINELDIKNVANPTDNLSDDTYRREITVHYTIIDKNGKSIARGLAKTYFPFRENNPKEIGKKYFSLIAEIILKNYKQGLTINDLSDQQKQAAQSNGTLPH